MVLGENGVQPLVWAASNAVRFPDYLRQTFPPSEARRPGTWEEPRSTQAALPAWSKAQAEVNARAEIFDRRLRPADARDATHVDPPSLAWLPVWLVELRVNGRWLYVHGETYADDPNSVVRSEVNGRTTGGVGMRTFTNARVWWVLPARASSPIASWALFDDEIANDDRQHRQYFELSELSPPEKMAEVLGEQPFVIDSDIAEPQARARALRGFGSRLSTSHSSQLTLSRPEIAVMRAQHLLWPLYFFPYAYVGDAAPAKHSEPFVVVISARTGAVVHRQHPSAARAVMGRFVRLLSFDKSAWK